MWQQPFALRHFNPVYVGLGSKPVSLEVSKCFPVCPQKRTSDLRNEYTPFCNGPGDVKSPRVIVTPPSLTLLFVTASPAPPSRRRDFGQ
jgi:hypothetical protein